MLQPCTQPVQPNAAPQPPVDGQQVARSCCYTSQRAGHAASRRDRRRTPCSSMQQRKASNGRAAQAPAPYIVCGIIHLGPPVQQQARHVQVAVVTCRHQGCVSILQVQQGATYAALTTSSPQQVQPKDAHEQSHTMQPCSRRWLRPAWDEWGQSMTCSGSMHGAASEITQPAKMARGCVA